MKRRWMCAPPRQRDLGAALAPYRATGTPTQPVQRRLGEAIKSARRKLTGVDIP